MTAPAWPASRVGASTMTAGALPKGRARWAPRPRSASGLWAARRPASCRTPSGRGRPGRCRPAGSQRLRLRKASGRDQSGLQHHAPRRGDASQPTGRQASVLDDANNRSVRWCINVRARGARDDCFTHRQSDVHTAGGRVSCVASHTGWQGKRGSRQQAQSPPGWGTAPRCPSCAATP